MDDADGTRFAFGRGLALASRLAESGTYIFTTSQARSAAAELGIPTSAVGAALRRLAAAGWIVRLRRDLYAGTGRLPGGVDVHPYAIATSMVQPSAVSRWTALSHHGLTTQLPWTVTVTSPKTVMTPSMRRPDRGHHRAPVGHTWLVGDVTIQFVKVREDRFFGVEDVWVDQQFRVPVFDRERTVLDLFAYPRAFGGLDTALAVLREYGRELDLDRLIAYSLRYASKAVNGRVGWSLEEVGLNAPGVEELRLHVGPGLQLLDPTRPAHGRRDGRWFVLDNISPRSAD